MKRVAPKLAQLSLAVLLSVFIGGVGPVSAVSAIERPTGMIVKDSSSKYYYTYSTPGTGYADKRLKYIGQPEVLAYYLQHGSKAYSISDADKASYTIHNHNLSLPCGEAMRTDQGSIAFFEPLGWPPGAQDQADPVFSFAENFPQYVGYVDWLNPYRTSSHHQNILKEYGYEQVSSYANILDGGIYPFGIPNCVVVKQSGSNDYYRVFRHQTPTNIEVERKMKISTPEMLSLWLNFNSYAYLDVDITALPNVGNVKMPPSLLVRTVSDPAVYFTDDEGKKVLIPSMQVFNELGFSLSDITYVSESTLNASTTKILY